MFFFSYELCPVSNVNVNTLTWSTFCSTKVQLDLLRTASSTVWQTGWKRQDIYWHNRAFSRCLHCVFEVSNIWYPRSQQRWIHCYVLITHTATKKAKRYTKFVSIQIQGLLKWVFFFVIMYLFLNVISPLTWHKINNLDFVCNKMWPNCCYFHNTLMNQDPNLIFLTYITWSLFTT